MSASKWSRLVALPVARNSLIRRCSFNRFNESQFDRLLVLDFEATCDSKRGTIRPQVNKKPEQLYISF